MCDAEGPGFDPLSDYILHLLAIFDIIIFLAVGLNYVFLHLYSAFLRDSNTGGEMTHCGVFSGEDRIRKAVHRKAAHHKAASAIIMTSQFIHVAS